VLTMLQYVQSSSNCSPPNDFAGASQFWYTDETAHVLAEQLLRDSSTTTCIAVVSAPSVFIAIRNILHDESSRARPTVKLLEYDRRFKVLGDDGTGDHNASSHLHQY